MSQFEAPWQAQAYAMALLLQERGVVTAAEWAERLGAEIAAAGPDDGSRYYEHWLAALERLLAERGLVSVAEQARRKAEWHAAANATPHGQPIVLGPQMTAGVSSR